MDNAFHKNPCALVLFSLCGISALVPATTDAQLNDDYSVTRNSLKDLRQLTYAFQDTLNDAYAVSNPRKKNQLFDTARRLHIQAGKESDRLRNAIDALAKKKTFNESVEVFKNILARYDKILKTEGKQIPRSMKPKKNPKPPIKPPSVKPKQPVVFKPAKPTTMAGRVLELQAEVRLSRAWHAENFNSLAVHEKLIIAAEKHGVPKKIAADATGNWSYQLTGPEDDENAAGSLEAYTGTFYAHLVKTGTPGREEQVYYNYLLGVRRIWRRDCKRRLKLMVELYDIEGRMAAAWILKRDGIRWDALEKRNLRFSSN